MFMSKHLDNKCTQHKHSMYTRNYAILINPNFEIADQAQTMASSVYAEYAQRLLISSPVMEGSALLGVTCVEFL